MPNKTLTSETDLDICPLELVGRTIEQCHFLKALKDAREVKTLTDGMFEDMRKGGW